MKVTGRGDRKSSLAVKPQVSMTALLWYSQWYDIGMDVRRVTNSVSGWI